MKGFTTKESQQFKIGFLILNCLWVIVSVILCQHWSDELKAADAILNIIGVAGILNILVIIIMLARLRKWSVAFWVFLVLFIFIFGPIAIFNIQYIFTRPTEKDFAFKAKTREYLAFYKPNDVCIFEDSKLRTDTFQVTSIDSSLHIPPLIGFLGPGASKNIRIKFKQVSKDNFKRLNEGLLSIMKQPNSNDEDITLDFFHDYISWGNIDSMGVLKSDTLRISNISFRQYRDIRSRTGDLRNLDASDSVDITHIYWVNKYGIIAYRYKNGDLWKRINLH